MMNTEIGSRFCTCLGGHTSEALTLISALDFDRYSPRTYVISEGDSLSAQKAMSLESNKAVDPTLQPVLCSFLSQTDF